MHRTLICCALLCATTLTDCGIAAAQTAHNEPVRQSVRSLPARPFFKATPLSRVFNPAGDEIIRSSETPSGGAGFGLFSVEPDEPVSNPVASPESTDPGRLPFLWEGNPRAAQSDAQHPTPALTADPGLPPGVVGTAPIASPAIPPVTAIPTVGSPPSGAHPADSASQKSPIELSSASVPLPIITPDVSQIAPAETAVPDEIKTAALPLPSPVITQDTPIDVANVREWRSAAEAELPSDDSFADVAANYDKTIEYLTLLQTSAEKTTTYRNHLQSIPERLNELRTALAETPISPSAPAPDTGLESIEQLMRDHEAQTAASEKLLNDWDAADVSRKERRPQLAAMIATAEENLKMASASAVTPPAADQPLHAAKAAQVRQVVLTRLLEQQLKEYRAEQDWYKGATDVLPLEQKLNRRNHSQLEKHGKQLAEALIEARRRESLRQAAESRRALQNAHPALKELAERNAELTRTRSEFQDFMKRVSDDLEKVTDELKTVNTDFDDAKDKEKRAGLTTAVGMLLRNHRKHFSVYDRFRRQRAFAEVQIARLQTEQLALEDEQKELGDVDERALELDEETAEAPNPTGIDLHAMSLSLLQNQETYISDLLKDYGTCLEKLTELDVTSKHLTDTVDLFRVHIDERVLWIRSSDAVNMDTLSHAITGIQQLLVPQQWTDVVDCLKFEALHYPGITGLVVVAFIVLLSLRSRFVRWLHRTSETRSPSESPKFQATAGALGLTMLIAFVWPCILWLTGWRLASSSQASDFTASVGFALRATAFVFGSVEAFRQICRSRGMGELHLKWPQAATRGIHANLVGLLMFGLPVVFVFSLANRFKDGALSDSLGRFAFIVGMPLLSFTLNRTINPNGSILREVLERNRGGWMFRLRRVWHVAVVGAPLLLAAMAFAGYQYTANALLIRLDVTFWLAIFLLIGFSVAATALTQAQRELMRVHRLARLRRSHAQDSGGPAIGDDAEAINPEQSAQKLADMRMQIGRLSRAIGCVVFLFGCWAIWSQVLPAFQILDRMELWPVTVQVAEDFEVEGRIETRTYPKQIPITPARLIIAIASLAFAIVAGRNLPALLELSVLRRLPIDAGGRHAITTMCRYGITIAGVAMACKSLGVGWSSVQWLIAALTVGLGFGLQEIFANFVSGLIILFERPIRIGDVLTIDGITGAVARIQIRATTIVDLDNKEYIVPNKEFVTGRVLNWTLSNETLRVVVKVGVAYGSDIDKCRALMLQIATDHPIVMADPPPVASFDGFGDSSLDLTLRCFIPNLHERVNVISDLHAGINHAFATSGIQIPFPQMDLNVKPASLPAGLSLPEQTIHNAA